VVPVERRGKGGGWGCESFTCFNPPLKGKGLGGGGAGRGLRRGGERGVWEGGGCFFSVSFLGGDMRPVSDWWGVFLPVTAGNRGGKDGRGGGGTRGARERWLWWRVVYHTGGGGT